MKALLMALKPGKGAPSKDDESEEEAPEGGGPDYKQMAKDAAKDGDWDTMIDAICAYKK